MTAKQEIAPTAKNVALVMLHTGDMRQPFIATPQQALAETKPLRFEVWYNGKQEMIYGATDATTHDPLRAIMNCVMQFDEWLCPRLEKNENLLLYTVHPRSVIARFYGRWGALAGFKFKCALDRVSWYDVCELVNYPAILSLEERQAFNPSLLCDITGLKSNDPMHILWQTLSHFQ